MRKFTWLLVLVVFYIPGLAQAQQPSVVTLFSEYCDGFYHFDGSIGASCSPAYIRQHADVVDERNGYLEIYAGLIAPATPAPTLKVAHYIHKGTHLLAVAEYESSYNGPVGQELKIYQWTGTELSDVTRERFAQKLSGVERNIVCDDYGGTYNATDRTWEGCWWEYVLPRNGLTVQVKLHVRKGNNTWETIDYTQYDFDLKSGTFVRKY